MRGLVAVVLIGAIPALTAGCHFSMGPDPFTDPGGFAKAGYTLTIRSATPAAGETIDWHLGPALAHVSVAFERPAGDAGTRLVVCLARNTTTFLNSSCRDTSVSAQNGEAFGSAGVFRQNDTPAWPETRYVLAFVVAGELVPDLHRYEDEISTRRLSDRVAAGSRMEHPLSWR